MLSLRAPLAAVMGSALPLGAKPSMGEPLAMASLTRSCLLNFALAVSKS